MCVLAAASVLGLALSACSTGNSDDVSIVRTTTAIAGAGVIGLERDTASACPSPTGPDPADGGTRTVAHAGGETVVPADPQRIVVLSTQALDSVCALGLWERIVGASTLDGPLAQPEYLGSGIALIPSVGTVGTPDLAKIAELDPDVILGSVPPDPATAAALADIAPTVFDAVDGGWKRQFGVAGQAIGRGGAALEVVAAYQAEAEETGIQLGSGSTQASIVRFTGDAVSVQGPDTFAGEVIADAGVRRPEYQRNPPIPVSPDNLTDADADLIYVTFDGDAGKDYGIDVMNTDEWEDLGAARDRRVFAVDDTIWNGNGVVAARAILTDLRASLNGYNS